MKPLSKVDFSEAFFRLIRASGAMPGARRVFGGRGVILMLHEIHDDPATELMTGSATKCLDFILRWLQENNWDLVNLEEALTRLSRGMDKKRFAVFTFDDGYRDILKRALPILERYNAPFKVYVPTGALTRSLYSWWLGLRKLFLEHDVVSIEPMGRQFICATLEQKIAGLSMVSRWVHQDLRRKVMLRSTFASAGISLTALNDRYFLSGHELRWLARHRLASIGAHTSSHEALSTLSPAMLRSEMVDNRSYLEGLLEQPICHLAYPYGHLGACGPREATIAAKAGFMSAVTTLHRPVTTADRSSPYFLPRIGVRPDETPASFEARVSGLQWAIQRYLPDWLH
jgi:peptidoglycan/xylan/chitin deacetylase (PgdA/CDA1 family)